MSTPKSFGVCVFVSRTEYYKNFVRYLHHTHVHTLVLLLAGTLDDEDVLTIDPVPCGYFIQEIKRSTIIQLRTIYILLICH